ncbi:MAG TPA: cytochrome C oxidase subunit II [Acidobacteriaceae bacterium]|jgi:cytochrome c oxidase subunit 2|nr:cytochrome C oxidase subunit II [Acidobacteriaceae bacterium]
MNWLPPNGSLHGVALDHLLRWNLAVIFSLFIAAHILLVSAFLFRRARKRDSSASSARSIQALLFLETLALLALTALYIGMDATGHRLWAATQIESATGSAIKVEVTGAQFQWYFRYPGPDGFYGALRPNLVSAPTGNPLGLDPEDPHAADDIVSAVLILPAGQPVDLLLRSQDVMHGFFVPGMRLKQDAIPGMPGELRFTPTTPGDYSILCSQVCGLGHSRMQARLRVVSPEQYQTWLAARAHANQR